MKVKGDREEDRERERERARERKRETQKASQSEQGKEGGRKRAVEGLRPKACMCQPEPLHLCVAADVATQDFPSVDADAELQ